jgi:ribonuclease-3
VLIERLAVPDLDRGLLAHALRHRSWCAENPGAPSNERLEFLGDAVLGLVVTDHLYTTYPDLPEGELAKVRAEVVSAAALAPVAVDLELGKALDLGRGEDNSGGREKSSILADALEAVFGAVYLSSGLGPARDLILGLLALPVAEAVQRPGNEDFKNRLQELAALVAGEPPEYTARSEGPDHAKEFHATVRVSLGADRDVSGDGRGRSKKLAEQAAARAAWESLLDVSGHDNESAAADLREDRKSNA